MISFLAARERFVRNLAIAVDSAVADDAFFNHLKELFGKYPGNCRVSLYLTGGEGDPTVLETRVGVKPTEDFLREIEKFVGPECWAFGQRAVPRRAAAAKRRAAAPVAVA